jgi:site-specific DNA recombinase
VKNDWEAWNTRSLAKEPIVRLILDGTAIARARQWLGEIEAGTTTIEAIATREACSRRHVHMTISLAFLAPSLVKAAVDGRLPRTIGVARLFDAPAAWPRQHQMLGLAH